MITKRIHSQDAYYKISPKNSGETSLNLSNEILQLIAPTLTKGSETSISFTLYREDFLKAIGVIVNCSPLYISSSTSSTVVKSDPNVFIKDFQSICSFFGPNDTNAYTVNLIYRNDGRIYLNSLEDKSSNFNIRHFLLEEKTTLEFDKDNNSLSIRLKIDPVENNSVSKELSLNDIPLQQIFYGAPGTGKSHTIKEQTAGESVIRTTFHPDSDYSTFVGAYKPTTKQVPMRDVTGKVIKEGGQDVTEDRIIYEFVDQAFLQAYISAWKKYASATDGELPQRQFLIIEEINRGNCAQIFGDLFQLLDRNDAGFSEYPIKADNDMRKQLSKAFDGVVIANKSTINQWFDNDVASKVLSGEVLLLPNNLYIWATMNTSDQSLFPIDSAFKRRWDWQYVPIYKGRDEQGAELKWSIRAENNLYDWWSFIEKINEQIASATNSADKKLGFFFCKAKGNIISAETFVSKVLFYLWIDVFKDYGFDSEVFNDVDGKKLTFDKFYMIDTLGKTVVRKDKVELFLKNLGVIIAGSLEEELIDEDGNTATTTKGPYNYDRSKYSINGQGNYSKGKTAEEVVRAYANLHPNDDAQTIVNTFLALNVNMPNLIETQAMYTARTQGSNDSRKRTNEVTLANGETVYVSSQFTLDRINDLIAKVNTQNWGITIAKN